MELKFHPTTLSCLRTAVNQTQNQEQTQELRIPDGMPDVGNVLGAWGQIVIRSKEWHSGGMSVTGGIMAWVLYVSDENNLMHCLDTWIPFQIKLDTPKTGADGIMQISAMLRGVDARLISARKLMLRACLGIKAEAFVEDGATIFSMSQLPEDIQLLKQVYPVVTPREAGEKPFVLEDDLMLPASCPNFERLVRYELRPEVIDQKVMAGKVVFRGVALLHILYIADDGNMASWDFEIPFSQFAELNREYDTEAIAKFVMAVTSLELEKIEAGFHLKAGLTGQYVICDKCMIEVIEDAYSPDRSVLPVYDRVDLPVVLDERTETIRAEKQIEMDVAQMGEIVCYPEILRFMRNGDHLVGELSGAFHIVYYNTEGMLQNAVVPWEASASVLSDVDADTDAALMQFGKPQVVLSGNGIVLHCDVLLHWTSVGHQGIPSVTGLEIGERKEKPADRPSLVLRRVGDKRLWEIAKLNNTTVEAIMLANNMESEPETDRILLIPIS